MKLLTSALHARLRANHDLRLLSLDAGLAEPDHFPVVEPDHFPVVRFFNPVGPATWLATEIDEHDIIFGLADLGFGCPELGSFALRELQDLRLPFGLGIERDLTFGRSPSALGLCRGGAPDRLARCRRAAACATWRAWSEAMTGAPGRAACDGPEAEEGGAFVAGLSAGRESSGGPPWRMAMARSRSKIVLSPSRDIPFDRLVLSQSNVRRVKAGLSIEALAADIARRTLLQSLNVRPVLDEAGEETGMFEIPAGGRRYRALELLVKQKRLARDAPVPCIVQRAAGASTATEDSYAENAVREQLHPLDQFRAMQAMVEEGQGVEAIAAHFMTTPTVVQQRLKLAAVSPRLHDIYADDGMTLDQLMAFAVSDDHERQEQVWETLEHSYNRSAAYIRGKLTEDTVRASDKRVRFVSVETYLAEGGGILRDLFEDDRGGWLTDPTLLDRLVEARLEHEAERIAAEGWKWVVTAIDLPWNATSGMRRIDGVKPVPSVEEQESLAALETESEELAARWSEEADIPAEVLRRSEEIDAEIARLSDRPLEYGEEALATAGAFVSVGYNGEIDVERGFVRPGDEPGAGSDEDEGAEPVPNGCAGGEPASSETADAGEDGAADEADGVKPLPERLVSDLTAWRTLALQDAMARHPQVAFVAVLHSFVLSVFSPACRESCMQVPVNQVYFSHAPTGLRDVPAARSIAERHEHWQARLPGDDTEVWDFILGLHPLEQADLFAHCASLALNAQAEIVPKYESGRITRHGIERRIAHSNVLARAVELDVVAAGWRPTAQDYFAGVTKARILADVTEARGAQFADMIEHLKKADMAREAERLLEDSGWLPEPLRTPEIPADDGAEASIGEAGQHEPGSGMAEADGAAPDEREDPAASDCEESDDEPSAIAAE